MTPTKGYYSVIQYCPDLGRFEAANVGVLLFCPEHHFLQARTTGNNSRIQRFFGSKGHDWKRINSFKRGLEKRLLKEAPAIKSLDDLQQFIAMRANLLQITTPLPMKIFDPEGDLDELFERIIGEPAHTPGTKSLKRLVEEKLSASGLDSKVVRDVPIRVDVLERDVQIPFAFQNGRFNLINPVRFESQNPEQSLTTACKYAVEGRSIYGHADAQWGPMQLVVLGQFRQQDCKTQESVERVFKDYDVKLFAMDRLPDLIDEIRRTGKDIDKSWVAT